MKPDELIDAAVAEHSPTAIVALFSGGNDSTTMLHAVKHRVDHACHINTGIGIEQTRHYVYEVCRMWGLSLIEEQTTHAYEDIVLRHGFPGPRGHAQMYSQLKERPLRQVRRRFVTKRGDRVLFLTGLRRHESSRRFNAGYAPIHRQGSIVWCNPLWDWTTEDMAAYRRDNDVPRNPVADLLHMSGECLCGAFAHPGELDEIALWFPEVADRIRALEHRAEVAGVPCRWGTRPPPRETDGQVPMFDGVGPLCSACEARGSV